MAIINRISATKVSGYTFNISVYSGTGPLAPPVNLFYNSTNKSVDWNLQSADPNQTHVGQFQADFQNFSTTDIIQIFVNSGAGLQLKGGVVIKQTTFPPKAGMRVQSGFPLNQTESDAFDINTFDFKETSSGIWTLSMELLPVGTNYFSLQSVSNIILDGEMAIQILVSPAQNPTILNVLLSNINYTNGLTIPVLISSAALVDNVEYFEQCDFKVIQ